MWAGIQPQPKFGEIPFSSFCVILLVLLTNSWCDLPLACTFTDSKGALWSDHAPVSLTKISDERNYKHGQLAQSLLPSTYPGISA